jgi:DNA-binding Xre family transcriptional regulator
VPLEKQGGKIEMKQKIIKFNIQNEMIKKNIGVLELSKKTHISIYSLIYILYFPLSNVRLTQAISICRALNIAISTLFDTQADIRFDIHSINQ